MFIKLRKDNSFLYKETKLRMLCKKLGFHFHILNKRCVLMEPCRIVAWRYCYMNSINSLQSVVCEIVFLDETWYDMHEVKKGL